jgi:hypothetical protein
MCATAKRWPVSAAGDEGPKDYLPHLIDFGAQRNSV